MKLRRAVAEDSPAVAAVVRAVYDEFGFTWDGDGYHADLRDVTLSYAAFFVAELDGAIVGTAGLTERGSLERLYAPFRPWRRYRLAPPEGRRRGGT